MRMPMVRLDILFYWVTISALLVALMYDRMELYKVKAEVAEAIAVIQKPHELNVEVPNEPKGKGGKK